MRILIANKFYYRRGGDCIYTLNLEELLKQHGHEVAVFAQQFPDNLTTLWSKYFPSEMKMELGLGMIEAFRRPFGTAEVKKKFNALLKDFKPEVVHLNNIHTQLSPIIAELAHRAGARVVWTLHDYKLLCPRYDCLRNGSTICETCFTDKHSVKQYSCMKNSRVASLVAYHEANTWNRERLEASTDLFICPSQFMADKMAQGGFNKSKLHTLCNFIDIEKCKRADNYAKGDYYCYIGRLSHEKGVKTLIEAANQLPYPIKIIGGGPLMDEIKAIAKPHIDFVGYKQWDEIKELLGRARFSVLPSEWYENNPLSIIEALCLGTPVLGARIGGIPELIEDGVSGMTFNSGDVDDLKRQIGIMWQRSFNYNAIADMSVLRYSGENYYNELILLYEAR